MTDEPILHSSPGTDFLDPAEVSRLDAAGLARRTAAIEGLVRDEAEEAERLRHPTDAAWSAIRGTGFFYQFVPRAFGGMGADTDTFVDAALPIARADPATAWAACFCAGHNRTLAQFPLETQNEIWGGGFPYIIAPQLGAPPARPVRVKGGYRVSGRWSWASGVMNADWVLATTMFVEDEKPPVFGTALIPIADVEIRDTWQADGLAASGSHDVLITEVFVPEHRMVIDPGVFSGRTTGAKSHPEPIFHMPLIPFAGFAGCVPILGAAQGLLQLYRDRLATKTIMGSNDVIGSNPIAQVRLARADMAVRSAEQMLRDAGRNGLAAGTMADAEQVPMRVQIRAQMGYAAKLCRDAAVEMMEGAGSTVHRRDQPFQKLFRDLVTMASHVGYEPDAVNELHGRGLLGMPPNSMIY